MFRYFRSLTSPLKSHDDTKIYRKHPQNLFIFINKWAFYPKLSLTDGRSTFFHCSNCTKVFLSLQCSHRLIYLSACAHISTSMGRNSRLHPLCVLCNICSFDFTTFKARLVMNRHFANCDDASWKPMSFDLFIIHDDLSIGLKIIDLFSKINEGLLFSPEIWVKRPFPPASSHPESLTAAPIKVLLPWDRCCQELETNKKLRQVNPSQISFWKV